MRVRLEPVVRLTRDPPKGRVREDVVGDPDRQPLLEDFREPRTGPELLKRRADRRNRAFIGRQRRPI
jgi:hypothetical protein